MKLRKRIALITVLILIINLFAPYSILFNTNNIVSAATVDEVEEKPVILNNLGIKDTRNGRMLTVQVAIVSKTLITGLDFQMRITDTSKLTPCHKTTGAANTTWKFIQATDDMYTGTVQTKSSYTDGVYRIVTLEPTGGTDLEDTGYVPGTFEDLTGDPELDEISAGYPVYDPVINLYFKVLDDSLTEDNITLDLFELVPYATETTGGSLAYKKSGTNTKYKLPGFAGKGFAEAEKEIDTIAVSTLPTNTTYNHGDTIDLTGGEIEVTYKDGTTEIISMLDTAVSMTSGNPANIGNQTVGIRYKGKDTSFPITVNDPITDFKVKTPMTILEYNHSDNLDFTGLTFEVTRKSGGKETLTRENTGVTTSETSANVDSPAFTQSTPDGQIPIKGTQVITFTYEGKTATQTIIVNDTIASIDVKTQPNKKVYKCGENLDLSGAQVEVTLGSGTKSIINLPDGSVTISSFNNTTTGTKQNLTATVAGKTAMTTIDVECYDYVTSIELEPPNKSEYNINEPLSLTGGRIKAVWKKAGLKSITLTSDMVSAFENGTVGIKTLTVTYQPEYTLSDGTKLSDTFTKTFDVEVINNVESITITPPSKTSYKHGEALATDGTITLNYADKTTGNVAFSNATITEADGVTAVNMSPSSYDNTNKLAKTLKISYTEDGVTGTADYPIEIINDVKSIKVTSTTHKKQYNIGESLDVTDLEITITRAVGAEVKAVTTDMVSTLDTSVANPSIPLVVTYEENGITKTTTFNVSVVDSIKRIVSVNLPKKDYKYNEELDLTGATITVEMGSGNKNVPLELNMITGYEKTDLGNQVLTITYDGKTATETVNVKDYVDRITITPDVVTGSYGTAMSKLITDNNITYTVHYAKAGDKTPSESLVASMVEGYEPNTTSPQSLKVNYIDSDPMSATNGQTIQGEISVTLANSITNIAITPPTKDKYNHGESVNKSGATVVITYADMTTKNGDISKLQLFEADGTTELSMSPTSYDSTNKMTKPVVLKYTEGTKSETANWNVTIINDIQGITVVSTDHKTSYNVNEPLDTSKLKISVTRAVGAPSIVDVTPDMVSGFSSIAETTSLPLTITYTENDITETTTYNITVADSVTGIRVKTPPEVDQKYNHTIDLKRSNT